MRGRLPEGKRCKSGTCDLNHDEKYPGRPCYSDPRVAIAVPYEYANTRPGALDRLKERRATEGKRLGVTPKPVTVQPAVTALPGVPSFRILNVVLKPGMAVISASLLSAILIVRLDDICRA